MKNKQVSLLELFSLCLSHWWKIAISAIAGAVVAFFITENFIMPTYVSRGSMYVNNNNGAIQTTQNVNLSDIATSQQLAFTVIELLTSDTFLTYVQEVSGLPYTTNQLKSMVTMEPLNETEFVEVVATTLYPEHSQKLVDTILHSAFNEIHRVIGGGNVKVIDEATLPQYPSSPSTTRNVVLGFLIGAFLCIAVIFLINMFDRRIKTEVDLMEVCDLPLLGVIPDLDNIRAGEKKNE